MKHLNLKVFISKKIETETDKDIEKVAESLVNKYIKLQNKT